MSLLGILNVAGSSLAAQQAALQVTSNNLANAADPNYTREVAEYDPTPDVPTSTGLLVGSGVTIASVQRQVDEALNARIRTSNSDQSSATTQQTWSNQVQSTFNALSGNGLSDQLNTFFSDWSTLANNPSDSGQRQVVIQDGQNVAQTFNSLSSSLNDLSGNLQQSIGQSATQVNQLASQIATLNQQIVTASNGGAEQPNSLLDQRDADLSQLSNLVNIQTVQQPSGSVNVYVGNEALVQGTTSQSLNAATATTNGDATTTLTFSQDGSIANVTSGTIGGLLASQQQINTTNDSLNTLANGLVTSLNGLYSSGQGLEGYTSVIGTNAVSDPTAALDSSASGLTSTPTSGSFVLTLTDSTTGLSTSTLVPITASGSPGDTTLNSLVASLNGITGVQAGITDGQLNIQSTNPNDQITFSQDSSGVLSALGINTFFSGNTAASIAVNSAPASNPALIAAAANGNADDNTTALAIANLNDTPQASLSGASLSDAYGNLVTSVGSAAATASNNATAATNVQQTLTAQQQSLSGVSTDEEALNMIIEQRTYQGAAELISTLNTMFQSLLSIT